ncbi:hypothetical protein B0T11DRAFT_324654 [Plectosphaerella cucumerina]|uniref:Uncharacterized protein n=1 Tax=Plectosphaerella cucumerina TaxID=40658 RepID=A0A8K0X9A0_9PEZI|nr:hypothetical protein B0T11DRAFT_324654 [Plectosphaerella cucumerina]
MPEEPKMSRCGVLQRIFGYACFSLLVLLSIIGLSKEYEDYMRPGQGRSGAQSWGQALEVFMTPETAKSLENDVRLRQSLLTMVDMTVDLSDLLSSRLDNPALQQASEILREYQEQVAGELEGQHLDQSLESKAVRKRQLFGGGGLGGGMPGMPDMGGALGGALMNGINNIGSQILGDVSGAGMFLGIGVGTGAAQGLNLSTADETTRVAAKVAADNKQEATGLNPLLQNAGVGLTSSLLSAINISSLTSGATDQLQPIAMSLAQGLGNGTVAGLNLNPAGAPRPMNDSSIANVIGTFGFGLTQSVTSNIDTKALLGGLNNPNNTAALMKNLPEIAGGVGRGFGQGAAVGLGLQADTPVVMRQMPDGSIDVGGVSETFTKSLAASFLQNGTGGQLLNMIGGSMAPAAPPGQGIPKTVDIGGQQVEISRVAQGFASGLLQGAGDTIQGMGGVQALVDGTATMPPTGMPVARSTFDDGIGGGATGLGAGLGGGGVLLASMLIKNPKGTPVPPQSPAAPPVAAPPVAAPPAVPAAPQVPSVPITPPAATPATGMGRRDLGLAIRQAPVIDVDTSNGFNLSVIINAGTVSMAIQGALDALTCQGFGGGLGNILLGLVSSKTIPTDALKSVNMDSTMQVIQQVIPTGTIELRNEGNFYQVDGQKLRDSISGNININGAVGAIKVNGMGLGSFIAFAVIHILFALIAFLNVLPLALGFESLRNLLFRARLTTVLPKIPKWNHIMWLFVITPSIIIVFVFGVVMYGSSAHFRSFHGIISLITTIVGLAAVGLYFATLSAVKTLAAGTPPPMGLLSLPNIRATVNQLFLFLATLSVTSGFKDLSSVALCFTQVVPFDIAIGIGFGLSTIFVLGSSIMGIDMYLVFRDARQRKKALKNKGKQIEKVAMDEESLERLEGNGPEPSRGPNMI